MKKTLLAMALLLASCLPSFAQKNTQTVYLKNGSVITGTLLEEVPGKSVKLQTKDGNIFVYGINDVERITHNVEKKQTTQEGHKGLDFGIDMGYNIATKGGDGAPFIGVTMGKKFNKNFYWGIGADVNIPTGNANFALPLTTDFRAYFPINGTNITPYLQFSTGYVFNFADDEEVHVGKYHETIYAPNFIPIQVLPSVQIPLSGRVDFNFGIGYTHYIPVGGSSGSKASGAVTLAAKFGFHKGAHKSKPIIETRERGFQITIEQQDITPWNYEKDDKYSAMSGALVLGYKWNKNISFGLGYAGGYYTNWVSGKEYDVDTKDNNWIDRNNEDWAEINGAQHKIFLRGTYRLNDSRISPIGSVDLGFRIYKDGGWHEKEYDGISPKSAIFLTPAIGADLRTTNNSYLTFKVGYEIAPAFKKKDFETYSYSSSRKRITSFEKNSMSGLFLSLGWTHTFKLGGNWFK